MAHRLTKCAFRVPLIARVVRTLNRGRFDRDAAINQA